MTAELRLADATRIDLARARSERYAHPGALPQVRPGSLRQDLLRRDFTINALALRLSAAGFGPLFDVCGGLQDLQRGRLRVLHGLSFIEDPTRALRAAGFAARLGFKVEPRTRHLIEVACRARVLERLSAARLRGELERLLGGHAASRAMKLLDDWGLLSAVHPALHPRARDWRRLARAQRCVSWYLRHHPDRPLLVWVVLLGSLLLDRAPADVAALSQRLQPPGRADRLLRGAGTAVRELLAATRTRERGRLYRTCLGRPAEHVLLALACAPAGRGRRALATFLSKLQDVRADITGRDLLRAGIPQGPHVARGLEAALAAKLAGKARTPQAQLRAALRAAVPGR